LSANKGWELSDNALPDVITVTNVEGKSLMFAMEKNFGANGRIFVGTVVGYGTRISQGMLSTTIDARLYSPLSMWLLQTLEKNMEGSPKQTRKQPQDEHPMQLAQSPQRSATKGVASTQEATPVNASALSERSSSPSSPTNNFDSITPNNNSTPKHNNDLLRQRYEIQISLLNNPSVPVIDIMSNMLSISGCPEEIIQKFAQKYKDRAPIEPPRGSIQNNVPELLEQEQMKRKMMEYISQNKRKLTLKVLEMAAANNVTTCSDVLEILKSEQEYL